MRTDYSYREYQTYSHFQKRVFVRSKRLYNIFLAIGKYWGNEVDWSFYKYQITEVTKG